MESVFSEIIVEGYRTPCFQVLTFFPADYDERPDDEWPVIFYLHGKGERGGDINLVKQAGLPEYLESADIPFIVFAPQCSSDTEWVFHIDVLAALFRQLCSSCNVDESRLFLTGNSMGGIGAWHLGIRYPRLFSAIVPICGGTYPFIGYPDAVEALKDTPVWIIHGEKDEVLPVHLSRILAEKLSAVNGNVRTTYYPEAGHDVWTRTYSDPEFYSWLLNLDCR